MQLSDGFTKRLHKANLQPILKAMQTGRYRLGVETDEVRYRQGLKDRGETLPRLKGKSAIIGRCVWRAGVCCMCSLSFVSFCPP